MPRFLIEVEHDATPAACVHAIEVLHRSGSHFLTHADWGCQDGVHKAWLVLELESKQAAMNLVPADFRARSRVVGLNQFTADSLVELHRRFGS